MLTASEGSISFVLFLLLSSNIHTYVLPVTSPSGNSYSVTRAATVSNTTAGLITVKKKKKAVLAAARMSEIRNDTGDRSHIYAL